MNQKNELKQKELFNKQDTEGVEILISKKMGGGKSYEVIKKTVSGVTQDLTKTEQQVEGEMTTKTTGHRPRQDQMSPQRDKINKISKIFKSKLLPDPNISHIYIDASVPERKYNTYVVIEEEDIDARLDIMSSVSSIEDLHPEWSMYTSIIAHETDPALDQIPDTAELLSETISQTETGQTGYAF